MTVYKYNKIQGRGKIYYMYEYHSIPKSGFDDLNGNKLNDGVLGNNLEFSITDYHTFRCL